MVMHVVVKVDWISLGCHIIKNTSHIRCPQGTVLGTIPFLIYINDLPEYIKHSRIRLFADDSMIYRQIKSQSDCLNLQEDLEAAMKWEQAWPVISPRQV
jgi:hypothetical protein